MPKKKVKKLFKKEEKYCTPKGGTGGGVYCLGFIGSLVFYLQQAGSFTEGVMGVLKALVWPALLMYNLLGMM